MGLFLQDGIYVVTGSDIYGPVSMGTFILLFVIVSALLMVLAYAMGKSARMAEACRDKGFQRGRVFDARQRDDR